MLKTTLNRFSSSTSNLETNGALLSKDLSLAKLLIQKEVSKPNQLTIKVKNTLLRVQLESRFQNQRSRISLNKMKS